MGLSKRCSVPSRLSISMGLSWIRCTSYVYLFGLSFIRCSYLYTHGLYFSLVLFTSFFWEILRISIPRPLIIGCLPPVVCDHIFYVLTYLLAIRVNTGAPVFFREKSTISAHLFAYIKNYYYLCTRKRWTMTYAERSPDGTGEAASA